MADRELDEYKAVKFYAENTTPKKAGFSKFQVGDDFYFCRYVDGDIAMLSQAYSSKAGRDNGIESVKKNEKVASRFKFETRGASEHGFGLRAGNGQEIAISPNYGSLSAAQSIASRLTGKSFSGSSAAPTKKTKKLKVKKSVTLKAPENKTSTFTSKDGRIENYRPLSFYETHGGDTDGFNSFEHDGAFYFNFVDKKQTVLISESYTAKAGRDNGIASVKKNMVLPTAYQHHVHKNGKHYFDINAGNGQEIATSRWYDTTGAALAGAAVLRGEVVKKPSANIEQNYQPVAFYRKHTVGVENGFEKFKGDDGEYYFTYFENAKLALISEGYPTAAVRDKGVASVEKNIKLEKRYVHGTGAEGKPGFILRAGNHKEIARSVGYGSAAAALTGAAYLLGNRRRSSVKTATVKATPTPAAEPIAPVAPKKPKVPLAAASIAVAGVAASKVEAKETAVEKTSVPVKAAASVAAPLAAAAVVAAAATPPPAPVVTAAHKTKPVVPVTAATPAAAEPAAAVAAGNWGWLKWLLLGLLALLALLFLIKSCAGGNNDAKVAAPVVTKAAVPSALISCWNGTKAENEAACPAKITCWDGSIVTSENACPIKTVEPKPEPVVEPQTTAGTAISAAAPKLAIANETAQVNVPKMTAPSVTQRYCGPSSQTLFNVSSASPKIVSYLGSNPQFGNSLSLTPTEFFDRLRSKYRTSSADKIFLDRMARSIGYGSFREMDASKFSDDRLNYGVSGNLGFGTNHALQFSTLNVTDSAHLEAFKVRSANGTDVHFMKRCGNFMYVCQP